MSLVLNLLRQLLEYYGVPAELMSWAWERKKYGSTRSFVRRLGKCLSLTPCPRPRFQAIQSLNSLTPEQSSTIGSVTPSLADVLWVADDDGEPYARFRFDERRGLVSAASKGRMKKSLIVNEDAFKKISALENELAHLRAQIAGIVAIHRPGNDQSCSSTVNLSNIPFSALPQPEMTSTPVPSSLCNIVVPPPPPPLPPSDFDSRKSAIELIKQRRAASKITKVTDSAGWQNAKAVPSMMEVLKDINKVKLRAVERSPGGTPLPKTKKITQSRWDPAALIAEALKEKFASQGNDDNESFDKENRFYGASPFSSPDTPEVGCRILKPSKKQTLIRANELM